MPDLPRGEAVTEIPNEEAPAEEAPVEEVETDDGQDDGAPEGDPDGTDDGAPEAPAADDPYAAYGGQKAVEQAMQLAQMLQTEDGIRRLYDEAGRVLGHGQTPAPEAEAAPEFADDDLITWGQVKELLQKEVLQPWQQTEQQRTEQAARQSVNATKAELGIEDEATWAAVLQLGDRHLGDDLSPAAVSAAVRKGHEEFVNLVKGNAQKYAQKKVATKAAVPKAPTGGSMTAPAPEAEPKDVKEAIARARARLMAG